MQTITWNGLTIQTDFHPASPAPSNPQQNQWNPANVQVVGSNLQLSLERNSPVIWQGQHVWAASEAVVQQPLNYGTYCCTFKVVDASGNSAWNQFDTLSTSGLNTSTVFGVFIFDTATNSSPNPNSEIDLMEVGFQNQPNNGQGWIGQQPGGPSLNNAQFALQPWDAGSPNSPNWNMVKRENIDISKIPASGEVTILCEWSSGHKPVNYYLAYGGFTSANFPKTGTDTITYSSPKSVSAYVPTLTSTMRLHLNLWPYGGPTTNAPVYCQVTNLEMP